MENLFRFLVCLSLVCEWEVSSSLPNRNCGASWYNHTKSVWTRVSNFSISHLHVSERMTLCRGIVLDEEKAKAKIWSKKCKYKETLPYSRDVTCCYCYCGWSCQSNVERISYKLNRIMHGNMQKHQFTSKTSSEMKITIIIIIEIVEMFIFCKLGLKIICSLLKL